MKLWQLSYCHTLLFLPKLCSHSSQGLTWTNLTRTERLHNSLCTACLSPCVDRHPTHIIRVTIGTRPNSYCKVELKFECHAFLSLLCKHMDERHLSILFGVCLKNSSSHWLWFFCLGFDLQYEAFADDLCVYESMRCPLGYL